MRGNRVPNRGGLGLSIVAFILGVLMGIIIVLGSVAGFTYYALNANLDSVLGIFGVDNSADESGRNKYVNTDVDEGGVANLLDLITRLYEMAGNSQDLTLGQIDDLVPATRGLVDQIIDALEKYVYVDYDEIRDVKFSEFGDYVKELVMDIRPSAIIDEMGIHDSMNKILEMILYGIEANYVEAPTGEVYPLYVDNFRKDSATGRYLRVEDGEPLLTSQEQYLVQESSDPNTYDLFVFCCELNGSSNKYFIAERDPDNVLKFKFTAIAGQTAESHAYGYIYNEEYAEPTGNYYIDNSGENVFIDPITVRSLVEGGGMGALSRVLVLELITEDGEPDELLQKLLGDLSIGDLIDGNFDFQEKINNLEIGALLSFDPLEDEMLTYFAYGLTGLSETSEPNVYSAVYKLGAEEDIIVKVTIENGKIKKIVRADDPTVELIGTTVKTIDTVIDKIDISLFVDVTVDSKIIAYIAYGITELKLVDGTYTAKLGNDYCTLEVDGDGNILSVTNNRTGAKVPAAGINDLSDRVNGVTTELTIGDIINTNGNRILEKLGEFKLNELDRAMDELEISDLLDVPADNNILAYLAYGITEINLDEGTAKLGNETVYIVTEERDVEGSSEKELYITGVYYDNSYNQPVEGTTINGVNDRLDSLMSDVPLKDIIDLGDSSLLQKLGSYTLSNISDGVNKLELSDVIDIAAEPDEGENNAIILYLAFGVTEVYKDGATGLYATDKDNTTYYFKTRDVDGTLCLDGMYSSSALDEESRVAGTTIKNVSTQLNSLTENVEIKYLIKIDESNRLMSKLGKYTINNISNAIDELYISDVLDIDADSAIMAYLAYGITEISIDEANVTGTAKLGDATVYLVLDKQTVKDLDDGEVTVYYIAGVYYDNAHEQPVDGTLLNEVGGRIDELASEVKIKYLIEIDEDDKLMTKIGEYTLSTVSQVVDVLEITDIMDVDADNAIMVYIAYGITGVNVETGTAKLGGNEVYLDLETDGETDTVYIVGVYKSYADNVYSEAVSGAKISDINARMDGLLNELTIGEIINISEDEDNVILNAIKDSTINGIGDTIDNLTLNQLYWEEIYKVTSFDDVDGNGQWNRDIPEGEDGYEEQIIIEAKLRKAVSGTPADSENEIEFNANYIYYTLKDGKLVLVEATETTARGKLAELPVDGEYYTYGACQGAWTLILNEDGNEKVVSMNDIGDMITSVSNNLRNATLRELDAAGIFDFTDNDLNIPVDDNGTTLGDLPLNDALEKLIEILNWYNSAMGRD